MLEVTLLPLWMLEDHQMAATQIMEQMFRTFFFSFKNFGLEPLIRLLVYPGFI